MDNKTERIIVLSLALVNLASTICVYDPNEDEVKIEFWKRLQDACEDAVYDFFFLGDFKARNRQQPIDLWHSNE